MARVVLGLSRPEVATLLAPPVLRRALLGAALATCVGCGVDPSVGYGTPDAGPIVPPGVVGIRTIAAPDAFSGAVVDLRCELIDVNGVAIDFPQNAHPDVVIEKPLVIALETSGAYVYRAGLVGVTQVTCSYASFVDPSPPSVSVHPGVPATVVTIVSRTSVAADPTDEGTNVLCEIRDAGGNVVTDPGVSIELGNPFAGTVTGATATFTEAGTQTLGCILPGAVTTWADVAVVAGKPASIVLDVQPAQSVYRPGSTVAATVAVFDTYGNAADSSGLVVASDPAASATPGTLQFRYDTPGTFAIVASIASGTSTGNPITASASVLINDGAPGIECNPTQYRVAGASGNSWSALHVAGAVHDQNGVKSVKVDGTTVSLDGSGNYAATVDPEFGANCYLVEATDEQDQVTTRCCPYLASEYYRAENATAPSSISFALTQAGMDDHVTSSLVNSLGDVFDRGITPTSLANYLHAYFIAPTSQGGRNYYLGRGCVQIIFNFCVDVYYQPSQQRIAMDSVNIDANLSSPGLTTPLSLSGFKLGIRSEGIAGLASSQGIASVSSATGSANWDIQAQNGLLDSTLLPPLNVNFNGLSVNTNNFLVDLFAQILPGVITDTLNKVLQDIVGTIVDDILHSLTVDTFGIAVNLPRLDVAGQSMSIRVGGTFPTADSNASALSANISPTFSVTGGTPQARTSLGIMSQTPTVTPMNMVSAGVLSGHSLGMALHDEAVNDLVHKLWRNGYFEGPLDPAALAAFGIDLGELSGLVSNFSLSMSAPLPPVGEIRANGQLRIGLAGLRIALTIPGSSDPTPLEFEVTGIFDATPTIVGDRIAIDTVNTVSLDLRVTTAPAGVAPNVVNALRTVATSLTDKIVKDVLAQSLVGLPVPSLHLPQTLGPISLARPLTLGIVNGALSGYGTYPTRYLVITGDILEQP